MSEELNAAFLILSDLHFGDDLLSESEGRLPDLPWYLKRFDYKIKRFFDKRCAAHDIEIVTHLPRYLKLVSEELFGRRNDGKSFDACLLLGDVATQPTGAAFKFAARYLTEERYSTGDDLVKHECLGLGFPPDKIIVIPGNHDKLLQTDLSIFQKRFLNIVKIPEKPGPRQSFLRRLSVGNTEFLFILVDASRYASEANRIDRTYRKHLACGEIEPALHGELLEKLEKIKQGEEVDGIRIPDYDGTFKILLIHYAIDAQRVMENKDHLEDLVVPHECVGLEKLIGELRSHLNLVLHGHLHIPKVYVHQGVPIVSATTTTQKNGNQGFFVLTFSDAGDVKIAHHKWLKTGFLPDPDPELNQLIANYRGRTTQTKSAP